MLRQPERDAFWASLPEGIRQQVDGYVLQDSDMHAIGEDREHGLATVTWRIAGRHLGSDDPDDEAPRWVRPQGTP